MLSFSLQQSQSSYPHEVTKKASYYLNKMFLIWKQELILFLLMKGRGSKATCNVTDFLYIYFYHIFAFISGGYHPWDIFHIQLR